MKSNAEDLARVAEIASLVAQENENLKGISVPIQVQIDDKIRFTYRTLYTVFPMENTIEALAYTKELCENADEFAAIHLAVRRKCELLMNSLYYETDQLIVVPHDDLDAFTDKLYELFKPYIVPMKAPEAEGADYEERDF